MPGRLILEIGQTQIPVSIKGTAVQIRAAIRRYALSKSFPVDTLTDIEIAEETLKALLKIIRDTALDQHRRELLQEQQVAMDAVLNAENDL